ncbi:class I adenylate-forming enzyme family protein [Desulfomonile tiedjei]|uniref:Acyl-CoA synthetase (AMP-forming)/AMP-acid ligase II n=1 Tax=Desulfomonile tiedjei (strain ATCC 49306 / DSM 6799 / DCB-1) TaxID=706587 RepID=I4BZR9_DESTA|nr:class I adenylate-forming enzyme family protein [Desulfomonile tiedjei]AFM22810.1 acyl-CoA synthetase (AMP-forming)/AMP-acid ligase II [Desulfomonile tiedjei DSM 6799]
MLIMEMLARNSRMYGSETALIEREPAKNRRTEITWTDFDAQANRTAHVLLKKGIEKGDRVVQLMMNCIDWLPVYFGILRTGAWAVPLNFRFDHATIKRCTQLAEAKVFVFGEEFIDRVNAIKDELKTVKTFIFVGPEEVRPPYAEPYSSLLSSESANDPNIPISILDCAALYFTSGTTGTPKATLLTHRNLESSCYVENCHHHQIHADNFLCIPPLYHTGAKMHWFGNFVVGAKAVILKGVKPRWILEAISEEDVTIVWLLVPWALDILTALENGEIRLSDYNLERWRLMHIGAQPVPPSLIRDWKRVFPHHQYDTNYGLTECTGPGCVHLGMENLHKVGAIGIPGLDYETRILDDQQKLVAPGQIGELAIKGPGVMKEYYRNPEASESVLKDGWLLTGDMARQDEDGFIWLVDRKKDIIITGGENIYPVEIEDFLQAHPKIQDVAVIGMPDTRLGEVTAAVIQVKSGHELTKEEVLAYCQGLPRFKRPREIIFGIIPRNPTGKIEKPRLRKQYSGVESSFKADPLSK